MSDVMDATEMGVILLALMTLWLYLPGFIANTFAMMWGKWLPKTGYGPWPIDGGRVMSDGNRMLGDGKTWNGLIGGSLTAGLLCVLQVAIVGTSFDEASVFVSPLTGSEDAWFSIGGPWLSAYILGSFLGFACLLGDMTGSFFKRRRGLKREGDVSSKAPLSTHCRLQSWYSCGVNFSWDRRSYLRMNYLFQWPSSSSSHQFSIVHST